jgi:NAD(P)-dependent dehydrogenase (short-subunit alcohol dehydrogenase family)
LDLTGRTAIVTGASRGLGREISASFLRAGASVVLVARDGDRLRRTFDEVATLATRPGQSAHMVAGDVSTPASCAEVVARVVSLGPAVMVLVNNAGILGPVGRLEDVDWEAWMDVVRVSLFGTALMCRAAIPVMRRAGHGKIINLSGGGATSPRPYFSAYAAAKAAVVRLTETLAEELREAHIDVNAVAPGALNTRLLDEVIAAGPERAGLEYERSLRQREEGGASLEKAASLALFLASARSDGITGRLLSAVWDDWSSLPEQREELASSDVYTLRRIVPADRVGKS